MDYTDLQPIIDELGVTITIRSKTVTAINEYGEETVTNSDASVKALVQKYNRESHNVIAGNIEDVPDLIVYVLSPVTGAVSVVYNSVEYRVVNIYMQPLQSTYLYYMLALKKYA